MRGSLLVASVSALLLAACAGQPTRPPEKTPPSATAPAPRPPDGAIAGLALPPADDKGGFKTLNSDLDPLEAAWHLRGALNVAALSCGNGTLTAAYNSLLRRQQATLAMAYKAERARWAGSLDAHMTRLYNGFAQPPVQRRFCAAAGPVATEAATIPPADFARFAPIALNRLEASFQAFYRDYAAYEEALAAWRTAGGRTGAAAPAAKIAATDGRMPPWNVQLGAFSGTRAAHDAWTEIVRRAPGLAAFTPRYSPASVAGLVRVRIGPVDDRPAALRLCASAAAAGLDCVPAAPGG